MEQKREEEIKNIVAKKLFGDYDCTKIISYIDFSATKKSLSYPQ